MKFMQNMKTVTEEKRKMELVKKRLISLFY